ncbi:MAG: hypothetical protein L3J04_03430 [Robiginitomaculum sp.]|nr:hypothetical protein [Robiginitomaculum sp.]
MKTDNFQSGPNIKDMLEAFTGFEIKTLRTIRDLVIAPTKIGLQALSGDKEQYLGQVRLFVLLIGLQSLLFSFTQFFDNINAQILLGNSEELIAAYSNQLAQSGETIDDVNKVMQEWVNLLFAPLNALMAFIMGAWFKLIDRRYTYFGHVLLFIVIANSLSLISMPLIALTNLGGSGLQWYTLISSALLAIVTSIFVWRFYKKSVWNGVWKIFLTLIVGIITTAIIGMLMQIILNIVAAQTFGIGPMSFLFQNIDLIISEPK